MSLSIYQFTSAYTQEGGWREGRLIIAVMIHEIYEAMSTAFFGTLKKSLEKKS